MYEAASLNRKTAVFPMSSTTPILCSGMSFPKSSIPSKDCGPSFYNPSVPLMGPGAIPITRIPNSPHSAASEAVTLSTAALAADE